VQLNGSEIGNLHNKHGYARSLQYHRSIGSLIAPSGQFGTRGFPTPVVKPGSPVSRHIPIWIKEGAKSARVTGLNEGWFWR
jgi:hypothetical protein